MRYLAQRILTGEWLHTDLELDVSSRSHELSGSGSLSATVAPDIGQLRTRDGGLLLQEWGTAIYAESDGLIRWGGLVVSSQFAGKSWKVECAGFTAYPHGIPFDGVFEGVEVDPADVVRAIWAHVQSQPDGDLGVEVVGSTDATVGTPEEDVEFETGEGEQVAFTAGPYRLEWWDLPDCGREIDALAREAPFDWVEHHEWSGPSTVRHWVEIAPLIGRRRDDLSFVQGVNVTEVVQPFVDGDEFANSVIIVGAGEGEGALRSSVAVRDGRLRRVAVANAKSVSSRDRLDALARSELAARSNVLTVSQITVIDHPHAPLESWSQGDLIRVEADLPWLGDVSLWCRVVAYEVLGDGTAVLHLSDPDGR